jgi:hypothetical protein
MSAYYQPGDYLCKIVNQGFAESKDKKTPYLFLVVRPVAQYGMSDEGEQEYPVEMQYDRTVSLWLTDKTVERTAERLCEIGWAGADWNDLAPGGVCDLTGTELRLTCVHELYNNEPREKWDFPFSGVPVQHDPSVSKKLNALFGKALKGHQAGAAKPARQAAPAGLAATAREEDLPF